MSTQREAVAAFRTALESAGAKDFRMQLATDKAVALAKELDAADLRHPEKLGAAIERYDAATAAAEPEEFEARLAHIKEIGAAAEDVWDAFEQQTVDGVEIIRRRA